MKDYAPSYYDKFHCIADRCRHNCCIGWEVDIDEDTHEKYMLLGSKTGEKIRRSISEEDGTFFFSMKDNGRCPFLHDDNLCEIIKNHGEEMLCDICREHPRFYNFFTDRTEWGLGLCCEEAARIILSETQPFSLSLKLDNGKNEENDDFENYVIFIRDECIKIIEEDGSPLSERLLTMLSFCEADKPPEDGNKMFGLLSSLERLDEKWSESIERLRNISDISIIDNEDYSLCFKNLAVYFIYRIISSAAYDGRISERAALVFFSVSVIALLSSALLLEKGSLTLSDIAEISRAYSAETEYSQENTEILLENM